MMFFLVSFCCDVLARVTRPWRQLFWLALHLYISVFTIVLNRVSEPFSKCMEVVTAYRRAKELERVLSSLIRDYEDEKSRSSELQKKLDAFIRDRQRIMETLDLVTHEKKKAVDAVRFLKNKIQDLELTNQQLAENEEAQRRGLADTLASLKSAAQLHSERKSLWQDSLDVVSSEHNRRQVQAKDLASKALHDVLINDSYPESCDELQSLMTRGSSPRDICPKDLEVVSFAESEKSEAFASSVFSALLSALVTIIAWEAKDPCAPLVIALFTVVGLSLASVVRFFSKLQSHQGFIAVALLSLNWFVLGTLAHPALPHLGKMGSGVLYVLGGRFLRFIGFGNVLKALKVSSHESFEL